MTLCKCAWALCPSYAGNTATTSQKGTIVIGLLKGLFPRQGSWSATKKLTHGNASALTQLETPREFSKCFFPSSAASWEDECPTTALWYHVLGGLCSTGLPPGQGPHMKWAPLQCGRSGLHVVRSCYSTSVCYHQALSGHLCMFVKMVAMAPGLWAVSEVVQGSSQDRYSGGTSKKSWKVLRWKSQPKWPWVVGEEKGGREEQGSFWRFSEVMTEVVQLPKTPSERAIGPLLPNLLGPPWLLWLSDWASSIQK